MVYGFISSLDDETTKVFFRSKKIRVNNIDVANDKVKNKDFQDAKDIK